MKKVLTNREFDLILQWISDEDKIGHFFIVDIRFGQKNSDEKPLLFTEIYATIFEKKRFFYQMRDLYFS